LVSLKKIPLNGMKNALNRGLGEKISTKRCRAFINMNIFHLLVTLKHVTMIKLHFEFYGI